MCGPTLRTTEYRDRVFCFRVTKEAMKPYVEATFGPWDDEWQRQRLENDLASSPHEIVIVGGTDIGLWSVAREPERVLLRKIYLLPEFQRRGIGSILLRRLIQESEASRVPIELRYLMVNPVASLYERLGFTWLKEEPPYVYVRRAL
jgi:ribosomal protein S18 acetylase RimI-like enzyme